MDRNWTIAEYQHYLKTGEMPGETKKPNKYNAKKVRRDGLCFDSQLEADYYEQLKLRQNAGEITGFCRQPRFVLSPGVEYVADFIEFYPDGTAEIVDTKGVMTDGFKLKMKLFRERYPRLSVRMER